LEVARPENSGYNILCILTPESEAVRVCTGSDMLSKNPSSNQPFWIDDPNPYSPPGAGSGQLFNRLSNLSIALSLVWRGIGILVAVALAWQYPWLWLVVVYLCLTGLLKYRLIRQQQQKKDRSAEIQQLAKAKTGASTIGSAIHTAGHPILEINQPVVLALTADSLSIYSYVSPVPLDTILLKDIQALDLVTYDDDGIPHTGIVDSTAQAMQVHFILHGQACTCLFRRMVKVRAVGWYQAIQKARMTGE
jgi:hypothetical protein